MYVYKRVCFIFFYNHTSHSHLSNVTNVLSSTLKEQFNKGIRNFCKICCFAVFTLNAMLNIKGGKKKSVQISITIFFNDF